MLQVRMKLIFVSMPYSALTPQDILCNIQAAEDVSIQLIKAGWAVYTPHKNTAGLEKYEGEDGITKDTWYAEDLEILRRCDAIFMGPRWEHSGGANGELVEAQRIGLEIFYYQDGIPKP